MASYNERFAEAVEEANRMDEIKKIRIALERIAHALEYYVEKEYVEFEPYEEEKKEE